MRKIGKILLAVGIMFVVIGVVSFPTEARSVCKESRCKNKTVSGSDYCSEHKCGVSSCKKKATKKGYCSSHQSASSRKENNSSKSKSCAVSGCKKSVLKNSNYCSKHTCSKSGCYNQVSGSSSYCSKHKKSAWASYDDGYEDVYFDGDYDDYRYSHDSEYADGVDDALDDLDW